MNELIGRRIKAAREKKGLTQAQLSELLGFKDRQTVAAIETGNRNLTAEELLSAMRVLGQDLDYFTDRFRLVGEGRFNWRADKKIMPERLASFEDRAGRWIATYRQLGEDQGVVPSPLQARLVLNERSTYEEAQAAAEALVVQWKLGEVPALALEEAIRIFRIPGWPLADRRAEKRCRSASALTSLNVFIRRSPRAGFQCAGLLDMTIENLAGLFRDYKLSVPFDL